VFQVVNPLHGPLHNQLNNLVDNPLVSRLGNPLVSHPVNRPDNLRLIRQNNQVLSHLQSQVPYRLINPRHFLLHSRLLIQVVTRLHYLLLSLPENLLQSHLLDRPLNRHASRTLDPLYSQQANHHFSQPDSHRLSHQHNPPLNQQSSLHRNHHLNQVPSLSLIRLVPQQVYPHLFQHVSHPLHQLSRLHNLLGNQVRSHQVIHLTNHPANHLDDRQNHRPHSLVFYPLYNRQHIHHHYPQVSQLRCLPHRHQLRLHFILSNVRNRQL